MSKKIVYRYNSKYPSIADLRKKAKSRIPKFAFDYLEGGRQSFTCFINNGLKIHRTKLERADDLFADHAGVMLAPPTKEHLADLPEWTRHEFRVPRGSQYDLFISGLGWIKVNGDTGALAAIHLPKGVKVMMRPSLI